MKPSEDRDLLLRLDNAARWCQQARDHLRAADAIAHPTLREWHNLEARCLILAITGWVSMYDRRSA